MLVLPPCNRPMTLLYQGFPAMVRAMGTRPESEECAYSC